MSVWNKQRAVLESFAPENVAPIDIYRRIKVFLWERFCWPNFAHCFLGCECAEQTVGATNLEFDMEMQLHTYKCCAKYLLHEISGSHFDEYDDGCPLDVTPVIW